eukprot:83327_1
MSPLYTILYIVLVSLTASTVVERPERHNYHWKKGNRSNPDNSIDLVFALKQQNVPKLIEILLDVSTPSSINYGQHLSMAEIFELTKPTNSTTAIIKNWLVEMGGYNNNEIKLATPNGDFLRITTTIKRAENLLNCDYYDYVNDLYPNIMIQRVDYNMDYHVPSIIASNLDFISPTKRFPSPLTVNITHPSNLQRADVTPPFLRSLYNVGDTVGKSANNIQAVASFLDQYYDIKDVIQFWAEFKLSPSNLTNIGPQKPGHGIEAELDVQYLTALGEGISTQIWYTPGRAPDNIENEPFLTWLLDVENYSNPPNLFSVSYSEDEKSVGYDYASRINTEFAKLGVNGTSFLFASGDQGAGGNCTASNNRECPYFPSASPYVTAVGGTMKSDPEVVWGYSGGGFSDFWPIQSWQQNAVKQFLNNAGNDLPPDNKFNDTGRGYPDISAQSFEFEVMINGQIESISGTSCATPTVAGIFALLNDLREQNSMPPLGFLNPLIYQIAAEDPTAFNDITRGSSTGCNGIGYPAEEGWDAVTGYGTPNYIKLAQHVINTGKRNQSKQFKTVTQVGGQN